jgi:hypothetical protein
MATTINRMIAAKRNENGLNTDEKRGYAQLRRRKFKPGALKRNHLFKR